MRQPKRVEFGENFPGVRGKVLESISVADAEGSERDGLYIHIRFKDKTELNFWMTSRVVIEEADLGDWKSGNFVPKRIYMASPEIEEVHAQDAEFERISRKLDREKKQKPKNSKLMTQQAINWIHDYLDYIVQPHEAQKFLKRLPAAMRGLEELREQLP
jgi:hypothetical protein